MSDQNPPQQPPDGGTPPPPPPPPPSPPPAPWQGQPAQGEQAGVDLGTRFLARLIDWVAIFAVYTLVTAVLFAAVVADAADGVMGGVFRSEFSGLGLLLSLVPGAYFILFEGLNDGRTIGKMLLGLQVRRVDGTSMDVATAFRREWWNLLYLLPLLGGLVVAGFAIFIAVTISNGAPWHDRQAGTIETRTR